MRVTATGWWGIPGRENPLAKIHAVCDGKAICGKIPHVKSIFQWCANGLYRSYVECKTCIKIIDEEAMTRKQALEELKRVKDNLATMEQQVLRLKKRVDAAEKAVTLEENGKTKP